MTKIVLARDRSVLDEAGRALADEALRALPDPYGDRSEGFMPKRQHLGRRRICGKTAVLTKEHIPPAAAFNRGRAKLHTVDEWIKGQEQDKLVGGELQGGDERSRASTTT